MGWPCSLYIDAGLSGSTPEFTAATVNVNTSAVLPV